MCVCVCVWPMLWWYYSIEDITPTPHPQTSSYATSQQQRNEFTACQQRRLKECITPTQISFSATKKQTVSENSESSQLVPKNSWLQGWQDPLVCWSNTLALSKTTFGWTAMTFCTILYDHGPQRTTFEGTFGTLAARPPCNNLNKTRSLQSCVHSLNANISVLTCSQWQC